MNLKCFLYPLSDFFFPPQCLLCNTSFTPENSRYFCNKCYDDFSFIKSPICKKCGLPFQTQEGEDHLCGQCITVRHFFNKARSVGKYNGALRKALHGFKYNEKSLLSKPLAQMLAAYGGNLLNQKEYDAIVPVPLHSKRLRRRGYNQALILAKTAGKTWGIKVDKMSLEKTKWTTPQTVLSKNARQKKIRGSFNCSSERVRNKNLLIIDDVYTSGSTVNECARILKKNGALKVDVLTLARTI